MERRLEGHGALLGLVVGAFGEASEDVHTLIHTMALNRVASADLLRNHMAGAGDDALSVVIGQIRRKLSIASICAVRSCLLSRLSFIGQGAKEGAKRRAGWERMERDMRLELEAQWHRKGRSHGIMHRGEFVIN